MVADVLNQPGATSMSENPGVVLTTADRQRESFGDPARGDASWFTLFSGDVTPTERMSAGMMELEPGGIGLRPHRHEPPEIYHVVAGSGALTVDGIEIAVGSGSTAFIPGDAEHGIRNVGFDTLRVFYVFPHRQLRGRGLLLF